MKTLRIVVACAAAVVVGHAWAQEQTTTTEAAQPAAQDVGGVTDMSRSDAGVPKGITRQQVYQDLLRSQSPGEQTRLQELYHGQ